LLWIVAQVWVHSWPLHRRAADPHGPDHCVSVRRGATLPRPWDVRCEGALSEQERHRPFANQFASAAVAH
jgi:hypothetical protein